MSGLQVALTQRQHALLVSLARRPGQPVDLDRLVEETGIAKFNLEPIAHALADALATAAPDAADLIVVQPGVAIGLASTAA